MKAILYSTPCDICGLAAGEEGLRYFGRWPADGKAKYCHPTCIESSGEREPAPLSATERRKYGL